MNPKSANPFNPCDKTEWTTNNLILQDPEMRKRAGVAVLDHDVSEMFQCSQNGGAASGAPFYWKRGSGQIGGMAYHYYTNNKRW